jgi:hypothetical protein
LLCLGRERSDPSHGGLDGSKPVLEDRWRIAQVAISCVGITALSALREGNGLKVGTYV